jgi:localization factor PodJL
MSNPELSSDDDFRGSPEALGEEDGHSELKLLIDAIAQQLTDADRRHTATLGEMRSRIATMGRETETLRHHVPTQFTSAFDLIESGVAELAKRLAAADSATGSKSANELAVDGHIQTGAREFVSGSPLPGYSEDGSGPWDRDAAEALTRLYESAAANFASASSGMTSAPGAEAGAASIDQLWLDSRFAEIAKGIEQSLAEIRPDRGFSNIGQRLDQFEQQFAKMFEGIATRADFEAVHLIEAHVGEVVNHLVQTQDQLSRLNVIEGQLASITRSLAEVQSGAASTLQQQPSAADVGAIAREAAEQTAMRFAEMASASGDPVRELRPLLERMISERQHGEENIAALLDTLQQAMIRLLDRVDAIEMGQYHTNASARLGQHEYDARRAMDTQSEAEDHVSDAYDGLEPDANEYVVEDAPVNSYAPSYDVERLSEASQPTQRNNEQLRQDYIAEARRAKMRLEAAAAEDDIVVTPPSETGVFSMSSSDAVRGPYGSKPIRPAAGRSNASGPSGPSPRLVILAVAALLALGGLWYTLGRETPKLTVGSSSSLVPKAGQAGTPGDTGEAQPTEQPGAKNTSAQPSPAVGPRSEATPQSDGQGKLIRSTFNEPKTTLPMLGVAVDLGDPVTEASMKQAERHQAMAAISGKLGDAAARESNPALVPASIVPTEAETEGSGVSSSPKPAPRVVSSTGALDLPPATVGPLSLRLAAAKGDPSAEFEVGARLSEGKGNPQNFKEAAKWYTRSADQGFAPAEYRLGALYERGLGLKADRTLAAAWYRRAANQGNVKAMHNLAVLSANQTDQSPDYTMAAQWFEQAASRGLADSEFNLAILYENGLGVKRDLKQAYMWISLAAQSKDADAVRRRDILRGKLTADEIAAAERMIAAWKPIPVDRAVNDARVAGQEWQKNPKNGIAG